MEDDGSPGRCPDLAARDHHRPSPGHRPFSRPRQVVMILVFDLGGPLLAYGLLRSAGMSAVAALVISGVLAALGIAIGALVDRRLDVLGVVVLAGIVVGTVLGLTSHNARLYLLEGSVPSALFALARLSWIS